MNLPSRTYRLWALSMAFMLLFSTMSWSIDVHYCRGELKTVNVFGKAKSCHEKAKQVKSIHCKKMLTACHKSMDSGISEKDCCNNEKVTFETLDQLFVNAIAESLDQLELGFVIAFVNHFIQAKSVEVAPVEYLNYKPPLPEKDIQILFSSFLI